MGAFTCWNSEDCIPIVFFVIIALFAIAMADHKYSINIQHFVLNPVAIYQSRNPKWSKKTMLETKVDQETSVVFARCIAKKIMATTKWRQMEEEQVQDQSPFTGRSLFFQVPCFLFYRGT